MIYLYTTDQLLKFLRDGIVLRTKYKDVTVHKDDEILFNPMFRRVFFTALIKEPEAFTVDRTELIKHYTTIGRIFYKL